MKKKFSKSWKSSKKPSKQRKYRANAPLNIKRRFLSSHLSKELREKYKTRNVPVKKNDKVKIMNGNFKGKTGKIFKVLTKKSKVFIEDIQNTKKDGTKTYYPINPSNVMIIELDLTDKKRIIGKKNE
jgi:large subunit ribosomal protein L24